MRASARSASCASALVRIAVTMSFSSSIALSLKGTQEHSTLDEMALRYTRCPRSMAERSGERKAAKKTTSFPVIRAPANRGLQRYFRCLERPFTLGIALRHTGPSRSCALPTCPSTRTLREEREPPQRRDEHLLPPDVRRSAGRGVVPTAFRSSLGFGRVAMVDLRRSVLTHGTEPGRPAGLL
jgi:hypothetical protein